MSDPRGFLKYPREEEEKRPVSERTHDWKEVTQPLSDLRIKEQANRCMDCGVPFCHTPPGCPLQNLIPEWNRLASEGHWSDALRLLHSTNNFPEITGKICPAPCESACVLSIDSSPVTIRQVESRIVEAGFKSGRVQPQPPFEQSGKTVAVVGSGPAGLAAAQQLARLGHRVQVYEKAKKVGGLLRYGIPDFKLEKRLIDRRIEQLKAEGVEFHTETEVGVTLSGEELLRQHDAVCLAVGAESARDIPVPGKDLAGVEFAMRYLAQQNRVNSGEAFSEARIDARGKRVVVIGGGDTGSDCVGTAIRQGALSVVQLEIQPEPPSCRGAESPWPQWPMVLRTSHAHEEGGLRQWSMLTKEFVAKPGLHEVGALQCVKVEWSGRVMSEISGSEFELPADLVLIAAGFDGVRIPAVLAKQLQVSVGSRRLIEARSGFQTGNPKVFVAGDARRGASLVVWAIAEGRQMAESVHRFLLGYLSRVQ